VRFHPIVVRDAQDDHHEDGAGRVRGEAEARLLEMHMGHDPAPGGPRDAGPPPRMRSPFATVISDSLLRSCATNRLSSSA
jgi:hypothetical protein